MAGVGFVSYQVDPDGSFKKSVDAALKVTDDLSPAFKLITADFYRTQDASFRNSPGKFKDLTEPYKKRKQAKVGKIYPILKANGYLETAATIESGSGNITDIGPTEFTLGVDTGQIKYAIFHQLGGKKIPKRPFFFIGPEEPAFASAEQIQRPERWFKILNEFIQAKLKETGMGDVK